MTAKYFKAPKDHLTMEIINDAISHINTFHAPLQTIKDVHELYICHLSNLKNNPDDESSITSLEYMCTNITTDIQNIEINSIEYS